LAHVHWPAAVRAEAWKIEKLNAEIEKWKIENKNR
jgi:hypothetical protein